MNEGRRIAEGVCDRAGVDRRRVQIARLRGGPRSRRPDERVAERRPSAASVRMQSRAPAEARSSTLSAAIRRRAPVSDRVGRRRPTAGAGRGIALAMVVVLARRDVASSRGVLEFDRPNMPTEATTAATAAKYAIGRKAVERRVEATMALTLSDRCFVIDAATFRVCELQVELGELK